MRKISILIILILIGAVFCSQVLAVEAGGELKAGWEGELQKDGSFDSEFEENLNLELYIPPIGNTEVSYAFQITRPLQDLLAEEKASYFTKKLYLKHRFDRFHLTVGRQPVSWSFGSLLNPVDYTLGADVLEEESNSKYTDALEVFVPLNWNSSLTAVASFPEGFGIETEKMKWGVRGRFGVKGYDLALNYVQEAEASEKIGGALDNVVGFAPKQRIGFSFKGDLGGLGIYGSFGHYFDQGLDSSNSYLLGADYSYNLNYHTKISIYLEYLGVELRFLVPQIRTDLLKMKSDDTRLDLLIGGVSYPIDDFSSISLMTLVNLDDGSLFLLPSYQNTLPGNIDLMINSSVFCGEDNTLFAPGGLLPRSIISINLSYPF